MVFAGYLENSGERIGKGVDAVADTFRYLFNNKNENTADYHITDSRQTDVLVNKNHGYILSLVDEALEGVLNGGGLGLGIYHEEVSLRVWGVCNMLYNEGLQLACSVSFGGLIQYSVLTPIPARRSPVTELRHNVVSGCDIAINPREQDYSSSPITARN